MIKNIFYTLLFVFSAQLGFSQGMTVVGSNNANTLVQTLGGSGVVLSNATINCGASPAGSTNYGAGLFDVTITPNVLGIDSGIVLTSGVAASTLAGVNGANVLTGTATGSFNGTGNGTDPDLAMLVGATANQIYDKCILEFDFVTIGDSVEFDYVFGSTEYQSFTCTGFNDVFGFFISGPGIVGPYSNNSKNIALVPGSTTCPVAISTIYCPNMAGCCQTTGYCFGNTPGCGAFNAANNTCSYFVCNTGGTLVRYQGFTTVLTAKSAVIPCSTYHMKLAVADKGDQTYDTGVFLKASSFSSQPIDLQVETGLGAANPYIIEGCDTAHLKVVRKLFGSQPVLPDTVQLLITGTATNSVDYNTFPATFTFTGAGGMTATAPSDTVQYLDLWAFNDGIAEGTENIKIYVLSGCFNLPTDSIEIEIRDSLGFNLLNTNTAICLGQSVPIIGTVDAGINMLWTPGTSAGVLDPNVFNTIITPYCDWLAILLGYK